jgi:hypothetical protein
MRSESQGNKSRNGESTMSKKPEAYSQDKDFERNSGLSPEQIKELKEARPTYEEAEGKPLSLESVYAARTDEQAKAEDDSQSVLTLMRAGIMMDLS